MVGQVGLEPTTPRLSSACSNQLSYRPMMGLRIADRRLRIGLSTIHNSKSAIDNRLVEARGFEPLTSSLQSWRSTN